MSAHSTTLKRPCKKCHKYYVPNGQFSYICESCKKKK